MDNIIGRKIVYVKLCENTNAVPGTDEYAIDLSCNFKTMIFNF